MLNKVKHLFYAQTLRFTQKQRSRSEGDSMTKKVTH